MGIPHSVGKMSPRNLWAILQQSYLCGTPTWAESDMPDLSGQVVIVTGGNSGLGKETVRALLQHNAKVYLACRSRRKAEETIAELRDLTGKEAIFLELDLANLSSIKAASEKFLSQETKLHILYNNAGIMVPPIELVTSDGYDLTFGTNMVGHFYLTKLLLPSLLAAAASKPGAGRVVNLTSVIHYIAVPNYHSFKDGPARRKMRLADLYSQSKWANAVFSAEIARRYGDKGIISIAVNPGNLRNQFVQGCLRDRIPRHENSHDLAGRVGGAWTVMGRHFPGRSAVKWQVRRALGKDTPRQGRRRRFTKTGLTAQSELPTYSTRASPSRRTSALPTTPKEYSYEIKNYFNKPWATLTLLAHPVLSRTTPTFVEGSSITGSVKFNLRSSDPIKSVVVFVRGDLIVSGDPDERTNFFRMRKFLWTPSMGDPRAPGTSNGNWEEKLRGEYDWPFSLKLPELATSPDGKERFHLPHTFAERSSRSSIEYYLELRINRGKLRTDDRLITSFGLFSMQYPSHPSQLRQLAYQSNVDIPGPYSDPEGWHALEPVQIRGKLFGERSVKATCTVFLAKPLCYTRATSIPCAMTIETDDSQAADVLASIKSSAVYLQRCVRCSFGYLSTNISPCGQATWWPSPDAAAPAHSRNADAAQQRRHIMGEIHLRRDLQPSTAIKEFQIEYAVAIFPPAAVGFRPESNTGGPLIMQAVEIVTRYAQGGVRPKPASTPPVTTPGSGDALVDCYYASVSDAAPRVGNQGYRPTLEGYD
ncbi:hypothetical protein MVEN_00245200 [Mycena venus]|uniref:NAD(P)-binding protein n=1 Tax=Mycena venus TaxID=2733690 RepID=A0A8H6YY29_9AGAR|nr:hypothetical protein MVEN_00245200 [Mycena venus]